MKFFPCFSFAGKTCQQNRKRQAFQRFRDWHFICVGLGFFLGLMPAICITISHSAVSVFLQNFNIYFSSLSRLGHAILELNVYLYVNVCVCICVQGCKGMHIFFLSLFVFFSLSLANLTYDEHWIFNVK